MKMKMGMRWDNKQVYKKDENKQKKLLKTSPEYIKLLTWDTLHHLYNIPKYISMNYIFIFLTFSIFSHIYTHTKKKKKNFLHKWKWCILFLWLSY